jgi:hypothetical protein
MVTDWNVNLERAIYAAAQVIPAHAFIIKEVRHANR